MFWTSLNIFKWWADYSCFLNREYWGVQSHLDIRWIFSFHKFYIPVIHVSCRNISQASSCGCLQFNHPIHHYSNYQNCPRLNCCLNLGRGRGAYPLLLLNYWIFYTSNCPTQYKDRIWFIYCCWLFTFWWHFQYSVFLFVKYSAFF